MGNQTSTQVTEADLVGHSSGESTGLCVGEPVVLHAYAFPSDAYQYLGFAEKVGFGAYHSGIEVHGIEIAYDGGFDDECGIYTQVPKTIPKGAEWQYKESVLLGYTTKTKGEVKAILRELEPHFLHKDYHILTNNCNHFTSTLALALCGVDIPPWINRLANLGAGVSSLRAGGIPTQEELMNMTIVSSDLPTIPVSLVPWINTQAITTFNEEAFFPFRFILWDKRKDAYCLSSRSPELFIRVVFISPCDVTQIHIGGSSKDPQHAPSKIRLFSNCKEFPNLEAVKSTPSDLEYTSNCNNSVEQIITENLKAFKRTSAIGIHIMDNFSHQGLTMTGFMDVYGIPRQKQ